MGNVLNDLTGKTFGRLKVLNRAEDYISPKGQHKRQWLCECSCDKHTQLIINGQSLKRNLTTSCGCYKKERQFESHKKYNKYDMSGEYGIGYASNTGRVFYFDLEDYNKIKEYCWTEDKNGYIFSLSTGERITMHRFVMGLNEKIDMTNSPKLVDHINGKRTDNSKNNLRVCSNQENIWNRKVPQGNSGVIGVSFIKRTGKWHSYIECNKKRYNLGTFINKKDAIIARLLAEKKYFGNYAGQSFLFEQYGIK